MLIGSNIELQGSLYSTVIQGPDDLQSTASFTCTVTDAGSFQWIWQYNGNPLTGGNRYTIWSADASRSSQLVINTIRHTDNGEYTCIVNRQGDSTTRQRTFELDLRGE